MAPQGILVKVIQVNAWLGHLMYPLFELLEQEDPDVVCLQEILSNEKRNPLFESFSIQQRLSEKFAYHYFSPTYKFPAFGEQVGMGNLILSKHPLSNQRTHFVSGKFEESQTISNYVLNIRNAQLCTVDIAGSTFTMVNHHGFHDLDPAGTAESLACMQKLIDELKQVRGPIIMCGDFNVQPDSAAIQAIHSQLPLKNLTTEYGLETTLSPIFRVKDIQVSADYIFVSPEIHVSNFQASDRIVSDHKALILECTL
ncbi:hypothetical protein EKI60_01445 [Candidatus Saccharibacteria bacterium]|nr:MAG: hypothetical protein EKI60_01445 [Candidatus Saccharibacteria bacterium]